MPLPTLAGPTGLHVALLSFCCLRETCDSSFPSSNNARVIVSPKALGSVTQSQNFLFKSIYSLFLSNTLEHVPCRARADVCCPRRRWHIARKSECTAQCGLGYRTLEIYCSKYSRLEGKIEKVDDRFCSSQAKPSTREKCTGECNVGGWRYSAWTEVRDTLWYSECCSLHRSALGCSGC